MAPSAYLPRNCLFILLLQGEKEIDISSKNGMFKWKGPRPLPNISYPNKLNKRKASKQLHTDQKMFNSNFQNERLNNNQ